MIKEISFSWFSNILNKWNSYSKSYIPIPTIGMYCNIVKHKVFLIYMKYLIRFPLDAAEWNLKQTHENAHCTEEIASVLWKIGNSIIYPTNNFLTMNSTERSSVCCSFYREPCISEPRMQTSTCLVIKFWEHLHFTWMWFSFYCIRILNSESTCS